MKVSDKNTSKYPDVSICRKASVTSFTEDPQANCIWNESYFFQAQKEKVSNPKTAKDAFHYSIKLQYWVIEMGKPTSPAKQFFLTFLKFEFIEADCCLMI